MRSSTVVRKTLGASLVALALVVASAAPASAQSMAQREGRWQFSIPINFVSGETYDGAGGSTVDISDDVGWGFGFGYNLTNRFMIGFETTWLSTSYDASVQVDVDGNGVADEVVNVGGTLDAASFLGVGQFNVLERGRFTPYIRGNLGINYADSNIPSGPAEGACWWDPWWGYVCSAWQPTYNRVSFAFGGQVGARADLGDSFFLELALAGTWIAFKNDTPFLKGVRLGAGWMF